MTNSELIKGYGMNHKEKIDALNIQRDMVIMSKNDLDKLQRLIINRCQQIVLEQRPKDPAKNQRTFEVFNALNWVHDLIAKEFAEQE